MLIYWDQCAIISATSMGMADKKISSRETGGAMGESAGCIQNTGKQNKID